MKEEILKEFIEKNDLTEMKSRNGKFVFEYQAYHMDGEHKWTEVGTVCDSSEKGAIEQVRQDVGREGVICVEAIKVYDYYVDQDGDAHTFPTVKIIQRIKRAKAKERRKQFIETLLKMHNTPERKRRCRDKSSTNVD